MSPVAVAQRHQLRVSMSQEAMSASAPEVPTRSCWDRCCDCLRLAAWWPTCACVCNNAGCFCKLGAPERGGYDAGGGGSVDGSSVSGSEVLL